MVPRLSDLRRHRLGQIHFAAGLDHRRTGDHENDQQDEKDIGERRDIDLGNDIAVVIAAAERCYGHGNTLKADVLENLADLDAKKRIQTADAGLKIVVKDYRDDGDREP